jgi:putative Holliday junction resolvase
MRTLAIDHGTKRIGIAVSDELGMIALPLEFIPAEPQSAVFDRLAGLIREKRVGLLLVGMPRNMDGSYGPAAEKVRRFVASLRERFAIPVKTWDERLTSSQANRYLIEAGTSREKRRGKVDQTAAAILLQSFLDNAALAPPEL